MKLYFLWRQNISSRKVERVLTSSIFIHSLCLVLQLASVQAASATLGIKHVYSTRMRLWWFFHYYPKQAESLKEIQSVLDLPYLKIMKPSDTCWLAHCYTLFCKLGFTDTREELKAATGNEDTHLDTVYVHFKKEWKSLSSDSTMITYPAGLYFIHKMLYKKVFSPSTSELFLDLEH